MTRFMILAVLGGISLGGCGGLGKPDDKKPAVPVPAATPLLNAGTEALKATLEEGSTPQSFSVTLSWSTDSDKVSLYRESLSRPRQLVGSFDRAVKGLTDRDLPLGETVTYLLIEEADLGRTSKVQIPVPRDMEVKGLLVTKRISGIHRLFLQRDAEVAGADGQLEIDVDQVISDEGILRSFTRDAAASLGNPGRVGEYVVLRARRGAGNLIVLAHGQRGGDGVPGFEGAIGAAGKPGVAATLVKNYIVKPLRPWPVFELNHPDVLADTAGKRPGEFGWNFWECNTPPTEGGVGEVGGKGGNGSWGARGGDAGNIFVQVANPGGLQVFPQSYGGAGGFAGRGGAGGKGGPGGLPGMRDGGELCAAAKTGSTGPVGPQGDLGEPGPAGKGGITCLKMGNAQFGDCDKLPGAAPYVR